MYVPCLSLSSSTMDLTSTCDLQKEPYHFSHLLFLSRVFLSSSSSLEEDPNAALNADESEGKQGGKGKKSKGGKKKKKTGEHAGEADKAKEQVWMYHPEDEYIARVRSALVCALERLTDDLMATVCCRDSRFRLLVRGWGGGRS